jgi:hypothetical protein
MTAIDLQQIAEVININADWPETMDLAKAKLFASAARRFLFFTPNNSSQPGGFNTQFDLGMIKQLLDQATEFIKSVDPSFSASVSIMGVRHGHR